MAHVTERRLEKVTPILNAYRETLIAKQRFDTGSLERDLCEAINTGYRGLKDFMNDLCKYPHHLHVALYYMQHSNAPGPVMEFQGALADAYGIPSYYSDEREAAQNLFWSTFFASQS